MVNFAFDNLSTHDNLLGQAQAMENYLINNTILSSAQRWVIGDTPRDLACARALGLRCALVATGRHSIESLAQLKPDLALSTLDDDQLRAAWS